MKRTILLIIVCIKIAVTANAQLNGMLPCYSEVQEEHSNKIRSKQWVSTDKFRLETPNDDGTMSVIIYRADSAKFYNLDMERKTWISFLLSQITEGTLSGIGALVVENHNVKKTFIKQEDVEGYMCNHYRFETTTPHAGGTTSYADWEEWIYEPYKTWIRHSDDLTDGQYVVRRNIVMGAQPEHLFEIPKDFKGMALPGGGMLEMITGKAQEGGNTGPANFKNLVGDKEEQEKMDGKVQTINSLLQQMKEAEKIEDPEKRRQEMARISNEMIELSKKKK